MAVQKRLIKGALACAFALMLSGCVTIPDAIKGSSPRPQQDLVRVMNAPQLYIGQEGAFRRQSCGGAKSAGKNPA
ncbi:lipoprotein [Salmonella enterica subsp. enterica]|nr:lipoprotein [Salmonella enterica subsp. enterica]